VYHSLEFLDPKGKCGCCNEEISCLFYDGYRNLYQCPNCGAMAWKDEFMPQKWVKVGLDIAPSPSII